MNATVRRVLASMVFLIPGAAAPLDAPAGAGVSAKLVREVDSLQAVCGTCHTLQVVTDTPRSLDDWRDTMQKMVDRGAHGTDDQYDDILDYLHRSVTTINVNDADAGELQTVLAVSDSTAASIIAARARRKLTGIDDLKRIPGVDAATVDSKSRLLYFR